jgi:hypothetical protein
VGIEGDGVGAVDPCEDRGSAFGELEESTVGGIDVDPEIASSGEV